MRNLGLHEYVVGELMAAIPGITSRQMFGGFGIYQNGIVFAMIIKDQLYFRVGENNKQDFENAGSEPFRYIGKNGKTAQLPYYVVSEDVLENREVFYEWVEKAVAAGKEKKKK